MAVTISQRDPLTGRNVVKDWTGVRVGSVTVICKAEGRDFTYQNWLARCDCGKEFVNGSYRFAKALKANKNLTCVDCAPIGRPYIPDQGAHLNDVYRVYTKAAKDRNKEFNLTKEQFKEIIMQDCFYCGAVPKLRYTSSNLPGRYVCNGVDRVDSSLGYNTENCVPSCSMCNMAKSDHTQSEFLEWVNRVHLHQQKHQE